MEGFLLSQIVPAGQAHKTNFSQPLVASPSPKLNECLAMLVFGECMCMHLPHKDARHLNQLLLLHCSMAVIHLKFTKQLM